MMIGILFFFAVLGNVMAWGEVQYVPISSVERHELSSGLSFLKSQSGEKKGRFIGKEGLFIKYAMYFPEFSNLLSESYKKIFTPGIVLGINFLRPAYLEESVCEASHTPGAYYLGVKGKFPYFDFFHPFAEGGLARSFCSNFKTSSSQVALSHYFAYGLFLSLKILDRVSIYSLDQDYGINDMGFKIECSRYYFKGKKKNSSHFCQVGFQLSF